MSATAFVLGATTAALVGAVGVLPGTTGGDVVAEGWAATGFLAMALPGVAGGAWLVREHGRSGSRFIAALQAGIFVRIVLAAVVAFGAARAGGSAITASIAGLAAGFLPVMAFEMAWFARLRGTRDVGTETRG